MDGTEITESIGPQDTGETSHFPFFDPLCTHWLCREWYMTWTCSSRRPHAESASNGYFSRGRGVSLSWRRMDESFFFWHPMLLLQDYNWKGLAWAVKLQWVCIFFFLPLLLPSFLLLRDWHWGASGKSPRLMPSKSFLKSHQSLQTHLCAFLCVYITSCDHASHSHTSQCRPVSVPEILGGWNSACGYLYFY